MMYLILILLVAVCLRCVRLQSENGKLRKSNAEMFRANYNLTKRKNGS
jgi:hypothetical protein